MNKFFFVLLAAVALLSCSGEDKVKAAPTQKELKAEISKINDSLQVLYKNMMERSDFNFPKEVVDTAINLHLRFYHLFPKEAYSAECLDKVQQLYMQKKAYSLSLRYTDTLLLKYPKYPKRAVLLLNAGSTGEVMQDTNVIRKYYMQLLREFPKLPEETKEMVEFRLAHLDMTFDQLVEMQIDEARKQE